MKKLTDKQKKNLDKTGDGKLTKEDFLLVRRLKNKNILPVKGLPMFVYAALNAKKSKKKPTIFI